MSCPTITLTPSSFSDGATGVLYNQTISASGGTGPYTYVVTFGSLPLGLSLDIDTGEITGIPLGEAEILFAITATDVNGCTKSGEYDVAIVESPPIIIPPVRSANPIQANHSLRLKRLMCCIADRGYTLSKRIKLGLDCCCESDTLNLLIMYFNSLLCYDPTAIYNCLTQVQVDSVWDDISRKCGICFSPYGEVVNNTNVGIRITENNIRRITEDGFYRIIE